ncbi:MAG: polyamine ABC transporter substrate-binding protein, partial [Gammaproteobacteria bacterium]|nr:polyamine ABC transporter substrate-binding protein [Gammaproteobacteria bacterium]
SGDEALSHMRRWYAAVLAAALAALLAACSGGPSSGGNVVNVYNWSDYIDPGVLKDFEKQYGIKVNYDVFDKNEVLETKLLTGNTGFDVVVPTAPFLELEIRAGALEKLDKSALPNLRYLDPEVQRSVAQYDPGGQYSADYMWITSGLGYNVQAVKARLPDAPLDSWRLLYDPTLVSKLKDCGVTVLDEPTEVIGTALLYLGKDPNSESPADLAAAMKVLTAIRPYVRYVNSSRYLDDLANGEICLALGWSGDVKQAEMRAQQAGRTYTIAYSIPKEGAVDNFDVLAIAANAPHPRNANLFINYLLDPRIAARNSNLVKYANGDLLSETHVEESVRDDPGIYPPPAVMHTLVPERAKSMPFMRLLTRAWTAFKTGS